MITKKDLEGQFSISRKAVAQTLEVIGYDTSHTEYDDDENLLNRFTEARRMLDEGQTRNTVAEHFGVTLTEKTKKTRSKPKQNSRQDQTRYTDLPSNEIPLEIDTVVSGLVEGYVEEAIEQSLDDLESRLPRMVVDALERRARGDRMMRGVEHLKSYLRARREERVIEEVAFAGLAGSTDDDDGIQREPELDLDHPH